MQLSISCKVVSGSIVPQNFKYMFKGSQMRKKNRKYNFIFDQGMFNWKGKIYKKEDKNAKIWVIQLNINEHFIFILYFLKDFNLYIYMPNADFKFWQHQWYAL